MSIFFASLLACGLSAPADAVPGDVVRFVAIGDMGMGSQTQWQVAQAMATVCAAQGCDFVLTLGDNIYGTGVATADDPQWQSKFERPYAAIDLPFYATLGNHDYGNGTREDRAEAQVARSGLSEKWKMPARHHSHSHGPARFLALDTQAMVRADAMPSAAQEQVAWLEAQVASPAPQPWTIAYGHHPYRSNGPHGNAGRFDGLGKVNGSINGRVLKETFDEVLCGKVDLYLAGHDHHREWLEQTCAGTQLMLSGAGAKLRSLTGHQPAHWQDDQVEGFAWIAIEGDELVVQFWNKDGVKDFEGSFQRSLP